MQAQDGIQPTNREILRQLAGQVAELAARPLETEKRDLWLRHNALEATRPVIFCDPENGWNEIIRREHLDVHGRTGVRLGVPPAPGDLLGHGDVRRPRRSSPFSTLRTWPSRATGACTKRASAANTAAPIHGKPHSRTTPTCANCAIPKSPLTGPPPNAAQRWQTRLFGDLLTVRVKTLWWWTMGMTWTLVNLRGMQQIMYDMIDAPDDLHRTMAFLRDGHMAKLDWLEAQGLLSLNNDGTYVGSGGFGWSNELPQRDFDGRVRACDMWGFGESQETVGVSPAMFAEFVLPYQLPLLERFGLNCYGCCEPLDKRWDHVKQIPRLRRVSVSPWSNRAYMAEQLGANYILSMKPNPADLARDSFDEARIRTNLRADLPSHPRLPRRSDHERQPHHPQRPPARRPLGPDRPRRSRATIAPIPVEAVSIPPVVAMPRVCAMPIDATTTNLRYGNRSYGLAPNLARLCPFMQRRQGCRSGGRKAPLGFSQHRCRRATSKKW